MDAVDEFFGDWSGDRDPNGRLFIVKRVTKFPDGRPRKTPVWERDGKIFRTLKAAKRNVI